MHSINEFESLIADFFGSKYAVATDSCTHALELCLRHLGSNLVECPDHTYLSVPMTFIKLNLKWNFVNSSWKDYYYIGNTNIIDAATFWKQGGYVKNSFMCLSFQFKKHLKLGRGGMILIDNLDDYQNLKKMSYDGRDQEIPWAEQDIKTIGYHYYMTPETAQQGIKQFAEVKNQEPKIWSWKDYPNLKEMSVFKNV